MNCDGTSSNLAPGEDRTGLNIQSAENAVTFSVMPCLSNALSKTDRMQRSLASLCVVDSGKVLQPEGMTAVYHRTQ